MTSLGTLGLPKSGTGPVDAPSPKLAATSPQGEMHTGAPRAMDEQEHQSPTEQPALLWKVSEGRADSPAQLPQVQV